MLLSEIPHKDIRTLAVKRILKQFKIKLSI